MTDRAAVHAAVETHLTLTRGAPEATILRMSFFRDLRSVQLRADAKKAQDLAVNGRDGTATIIDIRPTGTFVNEDPEVEMDLQVSVDGMRPYPATHRQIVARVAAPQFHAGATVPVKVDPTQPTSLIVA